jgi:hypothetical protein
LNTEPFKIVIIGAEAAMWYNDKIGEVFQVTDTPGIYYQYYGNKIIFKSDAATIKNNK